MWWEVDGVWSKANELAKAKGYISIWSMPMPLRQKFLIEAGKLQH